MARILGQVSSPDPIYAAPGSLPGGSDGLKPPVEIPASALDKANGARKFSMPSVLMSAYQSAVEHVPASCHLSVPLLAAIGQVESGSLVGRTIDDRHRVAQPVLGPVLNGNGFAAVADTDDGSMDGDKHWDRAMGPMQFIPSTWRTYGVDADGDGVKDPQDVDDAAASAAAYLCAGGRDLGTETGERDAVLSYNNSQAYYFLVLRWKAAFEHASSSLVVEAPDTSSAAVSVAASALLSPQGAPASPGPSVAPAPRPTAAPVGALKGGRSPDSTSPSGHSGSGPWQGSHGGPSSSPSDHGGTSTHGRPTSRPTGTPTPGVPGPSDPTTPSGPTAPSGPTTPADPSTPADPTTPSDPTTPADPNPDDRGPDTPETPDCTTVDEANGVDDGTDPANGTTESEQSEQSEEGEPTVEDQTGPEASSDDPQVTGDATDDGCPELPSDSGDSGDSH
ncbi:MAG: lytic murein transglycosylase [Nocardioidaceae bacterium]